MKFCRLKSLGVEMSGLGLAVILLWCFLYGRTSAQAWRTPPGYGGDAILSLAVAKGYAEAGLGSLFDKEAARLDAPYTANWNEWPITEDGLIYLQAFLAKVFGFGAAANLILLLAHLLAALSFYGVCRWLRYQRAIAVALALLYGFSFFLMTRAYGHLTLSYCWHLPLCLLVTWWAASARPFRPRSLRFGAALAISFLCGSQNPYYSFLYLQLLAWAALAVALRRQWRNLLFPLANIAIVLGAFVFWNLDTFLNQFRHGPNLGAVVRGFTGLEIYALKPIELLLIPATHHLHLLGWFWKSHGSGEDGYVYLGMVGGAALIWLGMRGAGAALLRQERALPVHFWQALWIIAFATVDGFNALAGTAGFQLLRGTNRYSVMILAVVLLFLARELSRHCPRRWAVPVAVALALFGLWDQTPSSFPRRHVADSSGTIEADRAFTAEMEAGLPPGAMVFQLPVADFPEQGGIFGMGDYEQFRPYLYSRTLRFSYGGTKGRAREEWQAATAKQPSAEIVTRLQDYGFSAIFINRHGYEDGGAALIAGLRAAGAAPLVESDANGWTALRIVPSPQPILPPSPPRPEKGFYPMIDLWRQTGQAWAKKDGDLAVYNPAAQARQAVLRLTVEAPGHGFIEIGGQHVDLEPGVPQEIAPSFLLPPGESLIHVHTSLPRLPLEGAPGPCAYLIHDVSLSFAGQ